MTDACPVRREVAVQVDAVGVLPRVASVAVGIQVRDQPEVETGMPALQESDDRRSRAFVAVDAADDEHLLRARRIADLVRAQRPPEDAVTDHERCYEVQ